MPHSMLQRLPSGLPIHATLGAAGSIANLTCIGLLAHPLQHGRGAPEIETKCTPNNVFGRPSVGPLW